MADTWYEIAPDGATWNPSTPTQAIATGYWVDSHSHLEIASADSQAVSSGRTLLVSDTTTISGTVTLSAAVCIVKGGSFVKGVNGSLVINGPFDAGDYQVFSGFTSGLTFGQGSNLNCVKAAWFGLDNTYSADCTTAIQTAINVAAGLRTDVEMPHGRFKFTKLYFTYDAVNNPNYPTDLRAQGRITFRGQGQMQNDDMTLSNYKGTVLESTDSTGPAITASYDNAQNPLRAFKLKNISIIANNTSWVAYFWNCNSYFELDHVTVYQRNSAGGGIYGYKLSVPYWNMVILRGSGTSSTGIGLHISPETSSAPGGQHRLTTIFSTFWDKGVVWGNIDGTTSGQLPTVSFEHSSSEKCNTTGIEIASGIRSAYIYNCHFEQNGVQSIYIRYRPIGVHIVSSHFDGTECTAASIKIGDSTIVTPYYRQAQNITIKNCIFINILAVGILRDYVATGSEGLIIENCYFRALVSGVGTGISLGSGAKHGVSIRHNTYANLEYNIDNSDQIEFMVQDGEVILGASVSMVAPASTVQRLDYAATLASDMTYGDIMSVAPLTDAMLVSTPVNAKSGMRVTYQFVQDGTGGRAVTWESSVGNLLSEGFEGVGYEDTWAETTGAGCSLDPDSTIPGTAPAGAESACLKAIVANDTANNAYATFTGSAQAVNYVSGYVRLDAGTTLANSNYLYPIRLTPTAVGTTAAAIYFLKSSTGALRIVFAYYSDGSVKTALTSTLVADKWYFVQFKYDTTNMAWEWRVDGVTIDSGFLEGTIVTPSKVHVGIYPSGNMPAGGATTYVDNIGWSNASWISSGGFLHSWSDTGNTANKRSSISFIHDGQAWVQDGAQVGWY